MLNIGAGEIAFILVMALLVLGPSRLPQLARGIGKFVREFRRQTDEVRSTLETEFYRMDQDLLDERRLGANAPVPARPHITEAPAFHGPLDQGLPPRALSEPGPASGAEPKAWPGEATGAPDGGAGEAAPGAEPLSAPEVASLDPKAEEPR